LGYPACIFLFVAPHGAFSLSEPHELARLAAYLVSWASSRTSAVFAGDRPVEHGQRNVVAEPGVEQPAEKDGRSRLARIVRPYSRDRLEAFGRMLRFPTAHNSRTPLLNNAAKFTAEGGQIWLTARREGSGVVVSVRDDGVGIPADMLDKVFEMFMQVDPSPGRAHGGLGIGLTLIERLVQMHGGTVEARSGGPGQGSEFLVPPHPGGRRQRGLRREPRHAVAAQGA
jgi:hypothetical protein